MKNLNDYIRTISDFPKPGISFKDITPLLSDSEASKQCLNDIVSKLEGQSIDKVVGVEARGFFFGMPLAQQLNAGFVPVRKPGKLPFSTLSESYSLEYGTDCLEIHSDAIKPGDKVLIHDDVLATGGTAEAVCKLVERLGGEIVQCNFIIELGFLNGASKLAGRNITRVLEY